MFIVKNKNININSSTVLLLSVDCPNSQSSLNYVNWLKANSYFSCGFKASINHSWALSGQNIAESLKMGLYFIFEIRHLIE